MCQCVYEGLMLSERIRNILALGLRDNDLHLPAAESEILRLINNVDVDLPCEYVEFQWR